MRGDRGVVGLDDEGAWVVAQMHDDAAGDGDEQPSAVAHAFDPMGSMHKGRQAVVRSSACRVAFSILAAIELTNMV